MTYFVAEIELDEGAPDYKVFSKFNDAELRHRAAVNYMREGKPVGKRTRKQRYIQRSRLWKVDTESVTQAAEWAKSGDATLLDDRYMKEGPLSLDDLLDFGDAAANARQREFFERYAKNNARMAIASNSQQNASMNGSLAIAFLNAIMY